MKSRNLILSLSAVLIAIAGAFATSVKKESTTLVQYYQKTNPNASCQTTSCTVGMPTACTGLIFYEPAGGVNCSNVISLTRE